MFTNIFKQPPRVVKETETTIYTADESISDWVALRYIALSEQAYNGKKEVNTISVTTFNKSDKQILLEQQRLLNPYKVTVDVASLQNSVHGSVLHEAILGKEPFRQEYKLFKWIVTGGADRIVDDIIYDFKHTSVYEGLALKRDLELAPEYLDYSLEDLYVKHHTLFKYVWQISAYNMLYNLPSNHGFITFVFNNWSFKDKAKIERNWEAKLKLYSHKDVEEYLTKRLDRLSTYQETNYLPQCSDDTLGKTTTSTYKIVAYGKTRAVPKSGGSHNTYEKALEVQQQFPGTEIKTFKSSSIPTLCMQYCHMNIKGVCEQGQLIKEQHKE